MRHQISQLEFEAECMRGWPLELCRLAQASMQREEARSSRTHANAWLSEFSEKISEQMHGHSFDLLDSEQAIRDKANRLSYLCLRSGDLDGMHRIAAHHGVKPPDPARVSRLGQFRRLSCPAWWRRRLRMRFGRVAEDLMRRNGLVRLGAAVYLTNFNFRRRQQHLSLLGIAIDAAVVENQFGESIPLRDIVDGSIANRLIRRTELMVRCRGFEEIAIRRGDAAVLYTLTAPSAFHAQLSVGGANPLYGGFTVSETMKWMNRQWARARSTLKRKGVLVYGFRIAEPYHDGTPHFHILLFMRTEALPVVLATLRRYWLQEYANEAGAQSHRVSQLIIDPTKGSAVGYIAKYVAKNIDGFKVDLDDESGIAANESAARVDAWASTHGIRQFQQIGGPTVGLWRELRRIRNRVPSELVELARLSADAGSFSDFIDALGGIEAGRRVGIAVWRQTTGELSMYDDVRSPVIFGIIAGDFRYKTRQGGWKIRWDASRAPNPRTVTGPLAGSNVCIDAGEIALSRVSTRRHACSTRHASLHNTRALTRDETPLASRPTSPLNCTPPEIFDSVPTWTRGNNCTVLREETNQLQRRAGLPPSAPALGGSINNRTNDRLQNSSKVLSL